jgi:hypothetical protein
MDRIGIFYFLILIGIFSCADKKQDLVHAMIEETKETFAPDKRTSIFHISLLPGNPIILTGETNLPNAKSELLQNLLSAGIEVEDKIKLLPDASLNVDLYAIINVSVANLRSQPRHSAELVTQALLGTPVNVLKEDDGWYLIQTPDEYIAWTNGGSLETMDEESFHTWKNEEKLIYLPTYGFSYSPSGEKISDLVAGSVFVLNTENKESWEIMYPDDRIAHIGKNEAQKLSAWIDRLNPSDSTLIAAGKDLMGVPYLWGGTSTKGVDCSGFTKTVYFQHGLILPRDASQQVHVGTLVDDDRDFSSLKVGDLLFFGRKTEDGTEKVIHVGMWIGNDQFIHASGDVHISSMDSLSDNFDDYNYNRYLRTKRIVGNTDKLPASLYEIYQSPEK